MTAPTPGEALADLAILLAAVWFWPRARPPVRRGSPLPPPRPLVADSARVARPHWGRRP